jgi:hypothetical protein
MGMAVKWGSVVAVRGMEGFTFADLEADIAPVNGVDWGRRELGSHCDICEACQTVRMWYERMVEEEKKSGVKH